MTKKLTKKRLTELEEKEKELDAINENTGEDEGEETSSGEDEDLTKEDFTGDKPTADLPSDEVLCCSECGQECPAGTKVCPNPNCKEVFE